MAILRTDSFTEYESIENERQSSFYGKHHHTDIKMTPPQTIFTVAIDDVYGPHVVLGDDAEKHFDGK